MFKYIAEALDFVENQRGNNTSLDNFKKIFDKYGNFQNEIRFVHITGTNGKGSTSKMIQDILSAHHYKVGMFTSPHMIVANDRIRINNDYISDERFVTYVNDFYEDILEFKLNFFQIYTLIALKYFNDENVDIAIIEVGIGGLLDSTNVINGIINIITNINYDHTEKLGKSIEEIAYQKAGIIKEGSHVITRVNQDEALDVIKDKVNKEQAVLYALSGAESHINGDRRDFLYHSKKYTLNSLAKYQVDNACIALKAVEILHDFYDYDINDFIVADALKSFVWFGRFEKMSEAPEIIIDGAHNIAGIKALINSDDQNSVVIFSALKDKDYEEMISLLQERYDELVFVEFDFYRSLNINDLKSHDFRKYENLQDALDYYRHKHPNQRIIICGSLYFISEVRNYFKGEFNDTNK